MKSDDHGAGRLSHPDVVRCDRQRFGAQRCDARSHENGHLSGCPALSRSLLRRGWVHQPVLYSVRREVLRGGGTQFQ